jgi:calcium-dependent protein kinase
MLSGCPPFEGDSEEETFKLIQNLEYDFDDESFDNVSEEAKNLIRNILTYEDQRLSLDEILEHDWISPSDPQIFGSNRSLDNIVDRLKNFTRATKLRKAVATLIATQISDRDIMETTRAFQMIDKNNDGELSIDELERGMGITSRQQR